MSHPTDQEQKIRSAQVLLSGGQKLLLAIMAFTAIVYAALNSFTGLLQAVTAAITLFYMLFVGMTVWINWSGRRFTFPDVDLPDQFSTGLPTYTILMPIAYQGVETIDMLLLAVSKLRYPRGHIQALLILEELDYTTRQAAEQALNKRGGPNSPFQIVVVPAGGPKSKPHACNYAMTHFATGEYVTILDAEDRPHQDFLRAAVADMQWYRKKDERFACVQGRLLFMNPKDGIVSRLYWAEYVTHFMWMMPGFVRRGLISPLGGTSNHFLRKAQKVVGEHFGTYRYTATTDRKTITVTSYWEPENVTEDADKAIRLKLLGYKVGMTRSVTLESAPTSLPVALKQRSRWTKGFMMTFLAWSRQPLRTMRQVGVMQYLTYLLFIGGTPLSLLLNPWVLGTTVLYGVSRVMEWTAVTLYLESLFPDPVFYPALMLATVGNLVLLHQLNRGAVRAQEDPYNQTFGPEVRNQQFGNVKWLLPLAMFWWLGTSLSAYRAAWEMLRRSTRTKWHVTPQTFDKRHGTTTIEDTRDTGSIRRVTAS